MPTQPKFITAPDIANRLIEALTVGCYREEACDYAGIERTALLRWMQRGEAHKAMTETYQKKLEEWQAKGKKGKAPPKPDPDEAQYAAIAAQVKAAEAQARIMAVTTIRTAMAQPQGKGWIAAMTYLERKDPAKWGRKDRTTNVNLNLDVSKMDLSILSDAELLAFNAIVQKLSPQEENQE